LKSSSFFALIVPVSFRMAIGNGALSTAPPSNAKEPLGKCPGQTAQ
jgi:hypothetical protein